MVSSRLKINSRGLFQQHSSHRARLHSVTDTDVVVPALGWLRGAVGEGVSEELGCAFVPPTGLEAGVMFGKRVIHSVHTSEGIAKRP